MEITKKSFLAALLLGFGLNGSAFGWNHHQSLMPSILSEISPVLKQVVSRTFPAPCKVEDAATLQSVITALQLNPATQVPPSFNGTCTSSSQISIYETLIGGSVDDPDRGMDSNLTQEPFSAVYDPQYDRRWMGGLQGPTSQGFRHMYFGGWKWNHPIATFQIPLRPLGKAPERAKLLAQKGRDLLQGGHIIWGMRLIAWAMHYIQDLAQPFHSVEVVSLKMVPWSSLLAWPPQKGFEDLVLNTTRIVVNYHWGYEDYLLSQMKNGIQSSPYQDCLQHPEKYTKLNFNPNTQDAQDLALAVAQASIEIAPEVGSAEYDFFGPRLMQKGADITTQPNLINYAEYAARPDLVEPRQRLHAVSCRAFAHASLASRYLLEWALKPAARN